VQAPRANDRLDAAPSPRATATPVRLQLDLRLIPQEYTTPILQTKSLGTEIIWSAGPDAPGAYAPDLYRYRPNDQLPELVFRNPRQESMLIHIAGSDAGYVVSEVNYERFGDGAWRLWYIAGPGADPVELDRNQPPDDPLMAPPTIAMEGDRIVWVGSRVTEEGVGSEIRMALATDPAAVTTVLSTAPGREAQFPVIHGDELWFGATNFTDAGLKWHVMRLDLRGTTPTPEQVDSVGFAFLPAVSDEYVVWKNGGENPLDWGSSLTVLSSGGPARTVQLGPQLHIGYPSVGSRFASVWAANSTKFYLYDLEADMARLVLEYPDPGDTSMVRPSISGNLLSVIRGVGEEPLELLWAELPE
jgi:hypothetical protein